MNESRELYKTWIEARKKVDEIRTKYLPEGVVIPDGYVELQVAIEEEQAAFHAWRESAGL